MTTLLPPGQQPPIRTQSDLEALWRRLMGDLGFGRTTLWLVLLDAAGRVAPVVVPIEDIPTRPTGATVWPVHRANDEALRVCAPDELAA